MPLSDNAVEGIHNAIEELKKAVAELEHRLERSRRRNDVGHVRHAGLQILVLADRIYSLLSRNTRTWT